MPQVTQVTPLSHPIRLVDTTTDAGGVPRETVYLLDELDTGVEAGASNTTLDGYLLFACYVPIVDNHRFKVVAEAALRSGFGGRVMGGYRLMCRMTGINIRRRLTADEKAQYGEGIAALVRISYRVGQDPAAALPQATWLLGPGTQIVVEDAQASQSQVSP